MLRTIGRAVMLGGVVLLAVGAVQMALGQGFPAGFVFGGLGALLVGALVRDMVRKPRSSGGSANGDSDTGGGDTGRG